MKWKCLIGVACLAISTWCAAFESWEHKRLGDLAYHVALQIYCRHNGDPLVCTGQLPAPTQPAGMFDPVAHPEAAHGRDALSYGDVVACVDYFLSTEKLIAGREATVITGVAPPGLPDTPIRRDELFPTNRGAFELAQQTRCRDTLTNREGARAQHVNHSHFQAEAIVAQRTNHMLAIDLRTREENLFAALLLNAISDHYLQDSFAPGHIATLRVRLTDLAATAYHDKHNRRGLDVTVPADRLQAYSVFALRDGGKGDLNQAVLAALDEERAANYFFLCPPGADRPRACQGDANDVAARRQALQGAITGRDARRPVHLKGDNLLWTREQDVQRYLMLLADVRSILDVLESRKISDEQFVLRDSFKDDTWSWNYEGEKNATPSEKFARIQPSHIVADTGPARYDFMMSDRNFDPELRSTASRYDAIDRIVGVNIGLNSMTFGDTHNRVLLGLETVVFGKPLPSKGHPNYAVLAGIEPFYDGGRTSVALTGRGVAIFPETEFAISLQGRVMRLTTQTHGVKWRPTLGARFDAGFTSFVTFYLQTGFDAAVQTNDSVRRGWSLGAGVQIAAPQCRIPLLGALGACN